MNKYKNKVKLLIVCSFIVFTSINHAMNNSLRKVTAPALQSGLRSYSAANGSVVAPVSNVSVPVNYATQNFKPIPQLNLQGDTNKLVQSLQKDDTASQKLQIINPLYVEDKLENNNEQTIKELKKCLKNKAAQDVDIVYIAHLMTTFNRNDESSYYFMSDAEIDANVSKSVSGVIKGAEKIARENNRNLISSTDIHTALLHYRCGTLDLQTKKNNNGSNFRASWDNGIQYYEGGQLKSMAIHEAGHAVAEIYNRTSKVVSYATIEAGGDYDAFIYPIVPHKNENVTVRSQLNSIIMSLSGAVAEQVFNTYHNFGYDNNMLDCEKSIKKLLFNRYGLNGDVKQIYDTAYLLTEEYPNEKMRSQYTDEIIVGCYKIAYQFVSEHKNQIEKLANALMEKGSLSIDEVYAIVGVPKPLFGFEKKWNYKTDVEPEDFYWRGYSDNTTNPTSIAKELDKLEAKLNIPAKKSTIVSSNVGSPLRLSQYGYDDKGKYVGAEEGYRDKNGNLEEID